MLEVSGLECVRGDRVLFSDLSFDLPAGQILQIEGANGCGKTTLLRVLGSLTLPDEGAVCWRGENIQHNRAEYLSEVTYVGHSNAVKDGLTVRENLEVARAMGRPLGDQSLDEVIQRVGLSRVAAQLCMKLSAGQKRRTALARLLASNASLWLLDEPFTAIDRAGIEALSTVLSAHARDGGQVILTTHHTLDFGTCPVQRLHLGT